MFWFSNHGIIYLKIEIKNKTKFLKTLQKKSEGKKPPWNEILPQSEDYTALNGTI
jgi:hypothetical protein